MTQVTRTQNVIACLVASFIATIVTLRIGKKFIPQIPFLVLIGLVIIGVLGFVIYRSIKSKGTGNTNESLRGDYALWHSTLRYFIAMDMVAFGLEKIFHLQFVLPLGILDNPFSSLNGEQLIWAFFGKYYPFTLIIAGLQIIGAVLLLFRRTWLLGVITLLPIFCNILLLDWFYDLALIVNLYITILTLATVYLLFSEYSRLKDFFFAATSSLPVVPFRSKNVIRFSALVIPVGLMALYPLPKTYPEIYGKYDVKSFDINGKTQHTETCRDSILTKVFIDNSDFVLEYNNYQQRAIGSYSYNRTTRQIKVNWRYPAKMNDTLFATLLPRKENGEFINGRMGKKIFKLTMVRVSSE